MTVFVMDENVAQRLREVAEYANEHRVPLAEMQKRHDDFVNGLRTPEPYGPEHTVVLPFGFKVVFTVEEHPLKDRDGTVWLRHMSMSSPKSGYAPIKQALEWVMGNLGFTSPVEDCMSWPEEIGPHHMALNVVEQIRETASAGAA